MLKYINLPSCFHLFYGNHLQINKASVSVSHNFITRSSDRIRWSQHSVRASFSRSCTHLAVEYEKRATDDRHFLQLFYGGEQAVNIRKGVRIVTSSASDISWWWHWVIWPASEFTFPALERSHFFLSTGLGERSLCRLNCTQTNKQ